MPRPAPGPFGKIDAAALDALRAACGAAQVITDAADRERFGSDETEDLWFDPEVVVRPRTTAEVAAVMKVAHARRVPVTPRAGGTGLSGGALPVRGGIVLSVDRMDSILEIDRENLVAVVEAGVITQRLQEACEAVGLYYPPDPDKSFVKRVIAEENQLVKIEDGRVFVNDVPIDDDYVPPEFRSHDDFPATVVKEGYYFVMGDHRNNSSDSRHWGMVPKKYIIGKVQVRWWPVPQARVF